MDFDNVRSFAQRPPPPSYPTYRTELYHNHAMDYREVPDYKLPTHKLNPVDHDSPNIPLVIVACGSFSPITYLHLRMFELAKDYIQERGGFQLLGGYFSPVSEHYAKVGLESSLHRVHMCELAVRDSQWLMVDGWEACRDSWQRTVNVLRHFDNMINKHLRWGRTADDDPAKDKRVRVMLLAGGDLIESFGTPNLWADEDLRIILGEYGVLILDRQGSDVHNFMLSHDLLFEYKANVYFIRQYIYNDISSTKLRLFLRRGLSIKYLLPDLVLQYIEEHGLYKRMA